MSTPKRSASYAGHVGGGLGKVLRIGSQAMNAQAQYYYNIKKPDITGDWSIRLQLRFMFPK